MERVMGFSTSPSITISQGFVLNFCDLSTGSDLPVPNS